MPTTSTHRDMLDDVQEGNILVIGINPQATETMEKLDAFCTGLILVADQNTRAKLTSFRPDQEMLFTVGPCWDVSFFTDEVMRGIESLGVTPA